MVVLKSYLVAVSILELLLNLLYGVWAVEDFALGSDYCAHL